MKKLIFLFLQLFVTIAHGQIIISTVDILKENPIFIDIRTTEEYKINHLENSINLPFVHIQEIVNNSNFDEIYSFFSLTGITRDRKIYILPITTKDELIYIGSFAYMLHIMGIPYVYIIKEDYKSIVDKGFFVTSKGFKLTPSTWEYSNNNIFLSKKEYLKKAKSKDTIILKLDGKDIISSLFYNDMLRSCDEINELLFSGKSIRKKYIILKSKDNVKLFFLKYLLSMNCRYGNVSLFKGEAN
jgi:3-mercaptopyruvate sulfurtransferase SseA